MGKLMTLLMTSLACWPLMGWSMTDEQSTIAIKQAATMKHRSAAALSVMLESITLQSLGEPSGDELFVDILALSSHNPPKHLRVPTPPHYWPSQALAQIKDVSLWQGTVQPQETRRFIVSLMEKDTTPWNVNDVIGTVILTIDHNQPGMVVSASDLNRATTSLPVILKRNHTHNFALSNEHGDYKISLMYK